MLSRLQAQIIQSITPTDLTKANLRDKVTAAAILYDKERLEMGLSTQNIAYADMIKAQQADLARLGELKDKLLKLDNK